MGPSEVLVVGAGPTGLALACDLLQRGVATEVIEQRPAPSTTSRAFALHARGLEILEDLGAGDVVHRTRAISSVTMHAAGHPLIRMRLAGLARSGHPGAYLLSQADVEAALRDRLRGLGGEVHFDHELTAAQQHPTHVTATVRHAGRDHELEARWLVGCDGAHSTVRSLAEIPFEGSTLEESFLLADLELDGGEITAPPNDDGVASFLHDDGIAAFLHDDGVLGLFPLPEPGLWRLVAQAGNDEPLTDEGAQSERNQDERAQVERTMERLLQRRTGRRDVHVVGARWWSRFRIHRRLAGRYRTGRMLIAGDAAHVHSPFGGQGMNVGLGDATNLGWKLAAVVAGHGGVRLLDSYEHERRPVAAQIVGFTTSTTRFAIGGHTLGRFVRDRLLPPLARARSDQPTVALAPPRALLERFAQLRVHYRHGPLASLANTGIAATIATAALPGPEPGDRAPDAPVIVHPAGTRTSLRACTRSRWALLRFGPPSTQHDDAAAAVAHHLDDDVLLVRILSSRASVEPGRWLGGTATRPPDGSLAEVLLEDHDKVLQRAYRPRDGEAVLVRPDGHVGWRSGWSSTPLQSWLAQILCGARQP